MNTALKLTQPGRSRSARLPPTSLLVALLIANGVGAFLSIRAVEVNAARTARSNRIIEAVGGALLHLQTAAADSPTLNAEAARTRDELARLKTSTAGTSDQQQAELVARLATQRLGLFANQQQDHAGDTLQDEPLSQAALELRTRHEALLVELAAAQQALTWQMRGLLASAFILSLAFVLLSELRTRRNSRLRAKAEMAVREAQGRFDAFMDHSPAVAYMKDDQGRMVYVNARMERLWNMRPADWLGKNDYELWPAEAAAKLRAVDFGVMQGYQAVECVETVPLPTGENRQFLSVKFPFTPPSGPRLLGGVSLDITEVLRAEEALRQSEERFRSAFEHAAIGMVLTEALAGQFMQVNPAFCDITGYSREEMLQLDFASITHPDDVAGSLLLLGQALTGRTNYRVEKRYVRKNGSIVWVRVTANPVRDAQGTPRYFIGLCENINGLKEAQESARMNEERWQLALQGTRDGIWDWDARTGQVFYSARWKEMLGYKDNELPNRPEVWEQLVHPDDLPRAKTAVQAHLDRLTPEYEAEYRIRCRDGGYKWILARGKAVWDAKGNPTRMVGAHEDITERKKAAEQLRFEAGHDSLTGLVNRRHFHSALESEIVRCDEARDPGCLCMCDIDNFKRVNDTYGHHAGDEVLVAFARLLRESGPADALAGRVGGDEFCILLPRTSLHEAMDYLNGIRERLSMLAFAPAAGAVFSVTASMGVAQFKFGMSSQALKADADDALYAAKERGRNRVHQAR